MPAVTVVTAPAPASGATMTILVEGGTAISMVSTPPVVETAAGAWTVVEQERPGRKTITQASAPGLRTLRFEHLIASANPYHSVETLIAPLRTAAEKGKRVQFFNAGTWASGNWWLVRAMEVVEVEKAADNTTSRATVTWECVEASPVSKIKLTKGKLKADPKAVTQDGSSEDDPEVVPSNGTRPNSGTGTTPVGNTGGDPSKPWMPGSGSGTGGGSDGTWPGM